MMLKPAKRVLVLGVVCSAFGAPGALLAQTTSPQPPAAAPQPPTERTGSPYDSNPACRDRDVSSADPACTIQDGPPVARQHKFDFNSTKPRPVVPAQTQPGTSAPPAAIVTPPQGANR